jgi:hypothetical protein
MATFSIDVAVNSKSVNELEQDLQTLEAQFKQLKIGDPGFTELGNKIKGVRSQLKDVELQFEGLDKEQRATALVDTFNGLTGAVGAVSSAFIAFGASSEAIEEAEKKLLGVIGVVNGLRDVSNSFVAANKLLGSSFKAAFTTATGAINVTRVALAGLGIGAIIFAVTELADAFDLFGTKAAEANEKAARSLSNAETAAKNAIRTIKDKGDIAVAQAELEGKSEKELLDIKKQSINDQLSALEGLAAVQNKDFLRRQKEANGDEEQLRKINEEFSKYAQENGALQAQLNKELDLLDINFKKGIKDRNKKSKDDAIALSKEQAKEEEEILKEKEARRKELEAQVNAAQLSADEAARQRRLAEAKTEDEEIQVKFQNQLAALQDAYMQEQMGAVNNAEALALIDKKYADLEVVATAERDKAVIDLATKRTEEQKRLDKETADSTKKTADDIVAAEKAKADAQDQFVAASRGALVALGGLFKEGSTAAKTAALADIAIGTGVGFINALDIAQKGAKATGPAAPFAFPIFYASQIAAVLGAASRAKAILSSGGSGTASGPTVPSAPSLPNAGISQSQFGGFGSNTVPSLTGGTTGGFGGSQTGGPGGVFKTYVLAGDVTSAQAAEAKINQRRQF